MIDVDQLHVEAGVAKEGEKIVWNRRILLGILIAVAFLALYLTALRRIANEKSLRSLELTDEIDVADHLRVEIVVTNIDLAQGKLMVRMRMRPSGRIGSDFRTPSVRLKLYVNTLLASRSSNSQ